MSCVAAKAAQASEKLSSKRNFHPFLAARAVLFWKRQSARGSRYLDSGNLGCGAARLLVRPHGASRLFIAGANRLERHAFCPAIALGTQKPEGQPARIVVRARARRIGRADGTNPQRAFLACCLPAT